MGQGISLKSERNNPWFKPWFNILLHTQSIVCATVYGQCLEYVLGIYNFGYNLKHAYIFKFTKETSFVLGAQK